MHRTCIVREIPLTCMLVILCGDELVEAAGVEPASEKACREKPTCVSDSESQLPPENRQDSGNPVRLDLGLQLRTEALGPSRHMTLTHRTCEPTGWSGYLIT